VCNPLSLCRDCSLIRATSFFPCTCSFLNPIRRQPFCNLPHQLLVTELSAVLRFAGVLDMEASMSPVQNKIYHGSKKGGRPKIWQQPLARVNQRWH
jgi:hypothetical protein